MMRVRSVSDGDTVGARSGNMIWGEDWPEVRALWRLAPTVTHINHGACGGVPGPVLDEQQIWRDRMEANPAGFFTRTLRGAIQEVREAVAAFLRTDPASLALIANATTAASTVLASFPFHRGDRVLLTDHGYGTVGMAAARHARAAGAEVDSVHLPLGAHGGDAAETILSAVTDRTRLVILDQVTSATALRLPVEVLIPALQERRIAVFVDGAHAPGMLPVDLTALGADFWCGNLHKWVCAPRGCAVLYVDSRWRDSVYPLVTSWLESLRFPEAFDNQGTQDMTPWLAAPHAIALLEHLGLARVRQHNVALALAGQEIVAHALGLDLAQVPRDPAVSMQLVPLPTGLGVTVDEAARLQAFIGREASVEVAVTSWQRRGFLRLSAHVYNAPSDYRRLAEALPDLILNFCDSRGA